MTGATVRKIVGKWVIQHTMKTLTRVERTGNHSRACVAQQGNKEIGQEIGQDFLLFEAVKVPCG